MVPPIPIRPPSSKFRIDNSSGGYIVELLGSIWVQPGVEKTAYTAAGRYWTASGVWDGGREARYAEAANSFFSRASGRSTRTRLGFQAGGSSSGIRRFSSGRAGLGPAQNGSAVGPTYPKNVVGGRGDGTNLQRSLRVLALESSADDSCAAIVDENRKIWSNVVIKQHEANAIYGGIHPLKAQHLHAANMPLAIARALDEAQLKVSDLDAIAYTRGPGMAGCLGICAASAKAIAATNNLPVLGIHHMQAHALTPLLTVPDPPAFPFLTLLVSGGHTQLVLAKSLNDYSIIANCADSKIGDAFDKVARLIQLPSSPHQGSGAILESFAAKAQSSGSHTQQQHQSVPALPALPIPLSTGDHARSLAFSFSGLISATERLVNTLKEKEKTRRQSEDIVHDDANALSLEVQSEISRIFQAAATGHLVDKVRLAFTLPEMNQVTSLVVSGGVASNQYLRSRLRDTLDGLPERPEPIKLFYPPIALCTDNAAMIAWAAILRIQDGAEGEGYHLPIRPKWSLEDLYDDLD